MIQHKTLVYLSSQLPPPRPSLLSGREDRAGTIHNYLNLLQDNLSPHGHHRVCPNLQANHNNLNPPSQLSGHLQSAVTANSC